MNQTLEQYLHVYCNYQQDNWSELLSLVEFAYNNTPSTTTSISPFFANKRYHPISLFTPNAILLSLEPVTLLQISMNYRVPSNLKSPQPNSVIRNLLMCNVPPLLILKQMTKSLSRLSSSEPPGLQRNSSKNILDPTKSSLSLVLYCSLSVFQSPYALVFHVSMLKPATSNTFSKRIQLISAPVIIDSEPKYKISRIVDSKIDH